MTSPLWLYLVDLIIPVAAQTQANALAQQLTANPADALTFQTLLNGCNASGSPAEPVTHLISSPIMQASAYATVKTVYAAEVAGSAYYSRDATTGLLLETNSPTAQAHLGQPWTAALSLSDQGLKRPQASLP